MDISNGMNTCIYNLIFTKFNEDFDSTRSFSYNIQYPSFFNLKNSYFYVKPTILDNINNTILSDVSYFKNGLIEEEQEFNNDAEENNLTKQKYKVISDYSVTFNKNHVLSTILNLMAFVNNSGPEYNELDNYNFDLLTGNIITLKDIFNEDVDYVDVVTKYVKYKISQNPDLFYPEIDIEIPDDQSFYLTDDGVVIYFGLDEISDAKFGIPKFKMSFEKFSPYIRPRFYCSAQNIYRYYQNHHRGFSRRF